MNWQGVILRINSSQEWAPASQTYMACSERSVTNAPRGCPSVANFPAQPEVAMALKPLYIVYIKPVADQNVIYRKDGPLLAKSLAYKRGSKGGPFLTKGVVHCQSCIHVND